PKHATGIALRVRSSRARSAMLQIHRSVVPAYTGERPTRLSGTDSRPSETRLNAQATNAETPAAMSVSTMRIPTCDAARRTGERGRVLWCPTRPAYDAGPNPITASG